MAPDQLRGLLRRQPFRPFRLIMSNGNTYDVVGREWMIVTTRSSAVGYPGESGDSDVIHWLDNDHIAEVKPIEAANPFTDQVANAMTAKLDARRIVGRDQGRGWG